MRFFLAALLLGAAAPSVLPLYEEKRPDETLAWAALPSAGPSTPIVVPFFWLIPGLCLGAALALLRRQARVALWLGGAALGALAVVGLAGRWIFSEGPRAGVTPAFYAALSLCALAFALIWIGLANARRRRTS